jgi:hypothetical protein
MWEKPKDVEETVKYKKAEDKESAYNSKGMRYAEWEVARSVLLPKKSPSAFAAPGDTPWHMDSRRKYWIACGTTWTRHPALANGGASWMLTPSSTFSTTPTVQLFQRLPQERTKLELIQRLPQERTKLIG